VSSCKSGLKTRHADELRYNVKTAAGQVMRELYGIHHLAQQGSEFLSVLMAGLASMKR
jgi:hypothetical protein